MTVMTGLNEKYISNRSKYGGRHERTKPGVPPKKERRLL